MRIPDIAACNIIECLRKDSCIRHKHVKHIRSKWQQWIVMGQDVKNIDECRWYAESYEELRK